MKLSLVASVLAAYALFTLAAGAPPASNITLSQPLNNGTVLGIPPNNKITLKVPGTQTRLQFVSYKALLSQTETDLCIIEALGDIFHTVVKNKQDGFLPLNVYLQSYGEVIIRMDDFVPPTQRLTYGIVTSTFRGLALFFSLYGYFEVDIEIYDGKWGHVGTGAVGGGSATSR